MKALLLAWLMFQGKPVPQPIPYSHKLHIGLGLQCKNCHTNPEPGELMGIPAATVCMGCHQSIKTDSPHIQKLAGFAQQKRNVPWNRVYQIPSYVYFSHKVHTDAGNTCEDCHGPVKEREALWKEKDISMGACMSCHMAKNALNDCNTCHEEK